MGVSHWEKYNTGVLYLPWGYDFSMMGTFIMYLMTAVGGLGLWKIPLPVGGMTSAQILEPACYVANVGITLPTAIYNIRQGYIQVGRLYWNLFRDKHGLTGNWEEQVILG